MGFPRRVCMRVFLCVVCVFSPKFRGALDEIHNLIDTEKLATQRENMSPREMQRVQYRLLHPPPSLEVPAMLQALRREADHLLKERRRVVGVKLRRRKGLAVDSKELEIAPFDPLAQPPPPRAADDLESLSEEQLHERTALVNSWLAQQGRNRQLYRREFRRRRTTSDRVHTQDDDRAKVTVDDVLGLGGEGEVGDEEGGSFLQELLERRRAETLGPAAAPEGAGEVSAETSAGGDGSAAKKEEAGEVFSSAELL